VDEVSFCDQGQFVASNGLVRLFIHNHVQHFINGKQTIDVTDEDAAHAPKEGLLALQIHAGPAMVVQFKDLILKTGK